MAAISANAKQLQTRPMPAFAAVLRPSLDGSFDVTSDAGGVDEVVGLLLVDGGVRMLAVDEGMKLLVVDEEVRLLTKTIVLSGSLG